MSTAICPNLDVLAYLVPPNGARKIRADEEIPASLEAGFEQIGNLDRDWVWVWVSQSEIRGVLLASPCHGTAFIWRVSVLPGEKQWAVGSLLRRFLSDCKNMGLKGYLTIIDPLVDSQAQLKSIIERAGGKQFGNYELMAAPTPKENL